MHFHMSILNPVVVKERKAAKFCAKPATATTSINSLAEGFLSISKDNLTKGCKVSPPTVPRANGISSQNETPFSILA
jgi:hypothetical protein